MKKVIALIDVVVMPGTICANASALMENGVEA